MKFYLLDTNAGGASQDLCFTDNEPKPIGSFHLCTGTRQAEAHPEGVGKVTLQLGDDYPGLELPSLLGNTDSMLAVKRDVADVILAHEVGEVEQLEFVLLNHKKRPHSKDYVFLNPIGTQDCLDLTKSKCVTSRNGKIIRVTEFVLASSKLAKLPQLFRPKESPGSYLLGEKLVKALRATSFTNLSFTEVPQS